MFHKRKLALALFAVVVAPQFSFAQADIEGELGDKPATAPAPSNAETAPAEIPKAPAPSNATAAPTPQKVQFGRSNYVDPSGAESHPFFDWSKHKGETLVKHPLAEKGLIEITKDKTYIYKVEESKGNRAASLHVGLLNPNNLKNPEGDGTAAVSFADNYDESSSPAILMDYEWQLWRTPIGKIGITAGSGIFIAQGHGHFVHPEKNPDLTPKETFTFAAFPTSAGAIYRLQFWDRQMIVPFGTGGGTLIPFTEFRDDSHGPRFGGALAAYFAAGAGLNLTYFDKFAAQILDREYGITRVYLTGEFREIVGLSRYNFGGEFINFGLTAEF